MEIPATRLWLSSGWAIWMRLSASMSKVMQAAHFAPFGQGMGFLITA
jgi:hypothetical protein